MNANDNPTTDEFGHRVPTSEEMNLDESGGNDERSTEDAVESEMRIRAMRFYNER